jgi:hypothetical protein
MHEKALRLFSDMEKRGFEPNHISFNTAIKVRIRKQQASTGDYAEGPMSSYSPLTPEARGGVAP